MDDEPLDLEGEIEDDPDLDEDEPEGSEQQAEPETLEIHIGDEPPEEDIPLVKQLRSKIREQGKTISDLTRPAPTIELGKEPDLWEDCGGDQEKFKAEFNAYNDRKRQIEQQEGQQAEQRRAVDQEWQQSYSAYRSKAAALPVPDYQAAEDTVTGALPLVLQSAIVKYARDPAKVVYALAKYPAKLNALAEETDPVRFILAMRDMEDNMKVNRAKPPAPEAPTIQRGSVALSGGKDKVLEKLEAKAADTGDYSAVVAHKAKGGHK
jgi:hypothetical protein